LTPSGPSVGLPRRECSTQKPPYSSSLCCRNSSHEQCGHHTRCTRPRVRRNERCLYITARGYAPVALPVGLWRHRRRPLRCKSAGRSVSAFAWRGRNGERKGPLTPVSVSSARQRATWRGSDRPSCRRQSRHLRACQRTHPPRVEGGRLEPVRLLGAGAPRPSRPAARARDWADYLTGTTTPLICRIIGPHNALKFHMFLEN
jgi:hypothetical protein